MTIQLTIGLADLVGRTPWSARDALVPQKPVRGGRPIFSRGICRGIPPSRSSTLRLRRSYEARWKRQ
jgi:hypothetical protein